MTSTQALNHFLHKVYQNPQFSSLLLADANVALYHYGMHNEDDHSWGCSYRCLQMLLSALNYEIASIALIQSLLVSHEWFTEEYMEQNPSQWIEPPHVAHLIRHHTHHNVFEYIYKRPHCPQITEEPDRKPHMPQFARKIKRETIRDDFKMATLIANQLSQQRCPLMIDDAVSSYIIAGMRFSPLLQHLLQHGTPSQEDMPLEEAIEEAIEMSQLLILDPHYSGNIQRTELVQHLQEAHDGEADIDEDSDEIPWPVYWKDWDEVFQYDRYMVAMPVRFPSKEQHKARDNCMQTVPDETEKPRKLLNV